jgi:hypothetical protein
VKQKKYHYELFEEWGGDPHNYYSAPASSKTFATREEASEAGELLKPLKLGGIIKARKVLDDEPSSGKTNKLPRLRLRKKPNSK